MKNTKIWSKPTVQTTSIRLAAGGTGPTNDKSLNHHS
jgi:hypothetical protein